MIAFLKKLFVKNSTPELHVTIMLMGLDNAGKSTLLSSIQGETDTETLPTIGFAKEVVKHGKKNVTYFDLGGGAKIRGIWSNYFAAVHAAIFVIDATDHSRLQELKQTFTTVTQHPLIQGKTILIFANKQDLPNAMSAAELSEHLQLHQLTTCTFQIVPCIAKQIPQHGNIKKGMTWLLSGLDKQWQDLSARVQKDSKAYDAQVKLERQAKLEEIQQRKAQEAAAATEQQE